MRNSLLWKLVYHLSGVTLLGKTEREPLGALPVPIRTSVIKTAVQLQPEAIECSFLKKSPLEFAEGEYEWVESWDCRDSELGDGVEKLLSQLAKRYPTYQKVALTLLWQAVEQGKSCLKIADCQPTIAALALAVLDSLALIERVAELYGLSVQLPEVEFYFTGSVEEFGVTRLLRHYRGAEIGEAASCIDFAQTPVRLAIATALPADVDFVSAAESVEDSLPEDACTFEQLESFTSLFLEEVGSVPPLQAHPVAFERSTLDYFARRYFFVPELKPAQLQLIQKALRDESGLGILPTGFGKSLIFQLYALLIPRGTLVISPLRSLIRDQVHNLNRPGLKCIESIASGDSAQQRKEKLRGFQAGRYRLLYVSPERLQIADFCDEIEATMQETSMGALAIDEAHCVSEWGHDFRPAYLSIERFRKSVEASSGRAVPIIALTATASEPVRKDILRVLGLKSDSIVQLASSDRPELSLSVRSVSQPEDKSDALAHLIQEVVPQVLRIPFEELVPTNENPPYPHAGLIFGIYANAHGRSTLSEGVHHIAGELRKRLNSEIEIVQVYSSTSPDCCPKCGSPLIQDTGKSRRLCLECQVNFLSSESQKPKNWANLIQKRQEAFQNSEFPLLVATKGYGMGIDKRNIRFLIHHSLSSSLEAYYQEAGRAGRDKQHAHVALIYHPPHPKCQNEYIDSGVGIQPPCVSNDHNFHFWKCPYFENYLCDYGHQARFVRKHYPGLSEDIKFVLTTYQKLATLERLIVKGDNLNNQTQLALYRLQQLGIVKDFSLKYLSLYAIEYQIDFDREWTLEQVADCLKRFLVQKELDEDYARSKINEIFAPFFRISIETAREEVLAEALEVLLGRIYETVPRMRYQMLLNQLDYARSHEEGTCRRVVLRGLFDSTEHLITHNYRCGFCDVCAPDLKFEGEKAAVLPQDAQVDEIADLLPSLLEGFDTKALQEVLRLIIEREAVAGLFARVANRLERNPTNLAALYLAGALARLRRGREMLAFDYLKYGFNEGLKQGLSPENLLVFYQEGVLLNPEEAFEWLTRVGGHWDSQEGLKFLIQEAAQRFGTDSTHYRSLFLRWQLRALHEASNECASLKPKVKALQKGFQRLI